MSELAPVPLKLSAEDRAVLRLLAAELQVPSAWVIRWALRYYALNGPYRTPSDSLPDRVREILGRVDTGPDGTVGGAI